MNESQRFFCKMARMKYIERWALMRNSVLGEYMRTFAGSCYACTWFRDYRPETVWKGSFAGTSCNVRDVS